MGENAQRRSARLVEGDEIEVFDVALDHRSVAGKERIVGVAAPVEDAHYQQDAPADGPKDSTRENLERLNQAFISNRAGPIRPTRIVLTSAIFVLSLVQK
jgi:hypothetical protein